MKCSRCSVEDILPLRHKVLREGKPLDTARFDGDHGEGVLHYGLFTDDSVIVCLTLIPSQMDGNKAWQLRGMATDTRFQGMGLGGRLIEFALKDSQSESYSNQFWCNARKVAVNFYRKHGWEIFSDEFDVLGIGPHYKMKISV